MYLVRLLGMTGQAKCTGAVTDKTGSTKVVTRNAIVDTQKAGVEAGARGTGWDAMRVMA